MLECIDVPIEDLFLDPNNPRLKTNFDDESSVEDCKIISCQRSLENRFTTKEIRGADINGETKIGDLYTSMKEIGFVAIDRVVVRKINGSDNLNKYLVIEGNRRISTVKTILKRYNNSEDEFREYTERQRISSHLPSFQEISCMLLETEGLSNDEIEKKIGIILGLRHHGSLLEWEPMPKAYNIYKQYMAINPRLDSFVSQQGRIKSTGEQLSVASTDVKKCLRTYITYQQLAAIFSVKPKYYSLIEAALSNSNLKGYFLCDSRTFELDNDSLEKMNDVCQFEVRGDDSVQNIISEPRDFKNFGLLIKETTSENENVRNLAMRLLNELLNDALDDESEASTTLNTAIDQIISFKKTLFWVDKVKESLELYEKLDVNDYTGDGNERARKDELQIQVNQLRKLDFL